MKIEVKCAVPQTEKPLLKVFDPARWPPPSAPPIWLMRQAGRYLPEYRTVRARAGDFLTLCYTPELAAEVTLQPIRRYGFDAAILFSDILVVPDALGQVVSFVEGEGPRLDPIRGEAELSRLDPSRTGEKFARVAETIARVRADLPRETTLIGFCGAPWTVATYMVGGRGSPDQADARLWAYRDPVGFSRLIDILVEVSIDYLCRQVAAGAEVIQIFDSWAGSLPDVELDSWVIGPTRQVIDGFRRRHPKIPVIGFARGVGAAVGGYIARTRVKAVGCDTTMPLSRMRTLQEGGVAVQGNLDPLLLVTGGEPMRARVRRILEALAEGPHIFNLGHGILPQTPPENVGELVTLVRRGA